MGGSHRVDLAWKLADKKLNMITVAQADEILEAQTKHFGTESLPYNKSLGRVLAENIVADRDLPPFDRSTVDGIAICFSGHEGESKNFLLRVFSLQVIHQLIQMMPLPALKS